MRRKIIEIDESRCNGCGACAAACHEGAIGMVDGKAHLLRDDYCDALGDCLPSCPTGAITFTEREAAVYDAKAVAAARISSGQVPTASDTAADLAGDEGFQLANWPVQIKLAPSRAPYFDRASLLVAADCTSYARGDFHERFMKGHVVLVGCSKLDAIDYSRKLLEIFASNDIADVTVVRMEVPCCGGMEYAVKQALEESGKDIPCRVVTLGISGEILDDEDSGCRGGGFTSCPSCSR